MSKRSSKSVNSENKKKVRRIEPNYESINSFFNVIHHAYVYMNEIALYSMSTTPSATQQKEYRAGIQSRWDARDDVRVTCVEDDEFDMAYTNALGEYFDKVFYF